MKMGFMMPHLFFPHFHPHTILTCEKEFRHELIAKSLALSVLGSVRLCRIDGIAEPIEQFGG